MGYSNSGKTNAIVRVTKELVKAGRRVGTLKHIHDEGFGIDTEGKDTWRHAMAGASTVIALAPRELTIINREDTKGLSIDQLFGHFREAEVDFVLIEGLYRRMARRKGVTRVLCARSFGDAAELMRINPRPVCILKMNNGRVKEFEGVPVLKLPKDLGQLMSLIGGTEP